MDNSSNEVVEIAWSFNYKLSEKQEVNCCQKEEDNS